MKKTPLRRTARLQAKTYLERRTPMAKVNRKRKASRWAIAFGSKARVRAIQALPCACGCGVTPSENAHVVSRAAGGTWRDIVPLCHNCHDYQHRVGIETVQREWGVDLHAVARRLATEIPA